LRFRSFSIIADSLFLLFESWDMGLSFHCSRESCRLWSFRSPFALLRMVSGGTLSTKICVKKYMPAVIRILPRTFDSPFRLCHTFWWMKDHFVFLFLSKFRLIIHNKMRVQIDYLFWQLYLHLSPLALTFNNIIIYSLISVDIIYYIFPVFLCKASWILHNSQKYLPWMKFLNCP